MDEDLKDLIERGDSWIAIVNVSFEHSISSEKKPIYKIDCQGELVSEGGY